MHVNVRILAKEAGNSTGHCYVYLSGGGGAGRNSPHTLYE